MPPPLPAPLIPEPLRAGWEQRLGARAFLWIGAITLALAAVFLVRYSIEEGYLSPEVRVILAALFGFALIGGAEKMRPRDDRVAQALAAAGVAALYGSLFAAVALYEMISKVAAGGGAAALTAFAIGLSLRHGMLVASLAFVGGFVSPAIIGSDPPNTPVLFGYLLAIAAGTLGVIRVRGWWPLGWGVLAGSAIWTVLWMLSLAGGLHWVGLFLVAVAGLFVWATWRRMGERENPPADVAALVWAALGLTGLLLVAVIVQDEGKQSTGWLALAAHGAGLYALARWTPRFQYVGGAGAAPVGCGARLVVGHDARLGHRLGRRSLRLDAILLGGFYAAGAFALLWNAGRPGFWAALSVAAALVTFSSLLVRAARCRDQHAVGPDQHRAGRAVPGRRRAAGALARNHDRRHRGAGLPGGRRCRFSSPPPFRSSSAANGSPWPTPSSSRRWLPSPPGSIFWPCVSSAGRCSPSSSCASCSIPRSSNIRWASRRS